MDFATSDGSTLVTNAAPRKPPSATPAASFELHHHPCTMRPMDLTAAATNKTPMLAADATAVTFDGGDESRLARTNVSGKTCALSGRFPTCFMSC